MKAISTSLMVAALTLAVVRDSQGGPAGRGLGVGHQSPAPTMAGKAADYVITVSHTGNGSLDVYLDIAGLPAGVAAAYSPRVVRFREGQPSTKMAVLTLSTPTQLPAGTYPFVVTAQHGKSPNLVTRTGSLVVVGGASAELPPPTIISITKTTEGTIAVVGQGTPGQLLTLQASFSVAEPDWQSLTTAAADPMTGILQFIDADAVNYPCRFYRLMAQPPGAPLTGPQAAALAD